MLTKPALIISKHKVVTVEDERTSYSNYLLVKKKINNEMLLSGRVCCKQTFKW